MPLTALALVLVAALLHALWNIVAKRAGGDHRFVFLVAVMIVGVWAPLALWAGVDAIPLWGWREWAVLFASGMTHLVYFLTLLRGYRVADLTVVYPLARGTGPLLSTLVAVLLLGERLSTVAMLGVVGVAVGVFLIAGGPKTVRALRSARHRAGGTAPERAAQDRLRLGLFYGAATGVCIAGYTVIDGYSVKVLLISPILVDYLGNLFRIPFTAPAVLRDWPAAKQAWLSYWRSALTVAVVSPVAYILVLYALQMAPISHVAPAREVSMLFAALLGGRLLGEGDRWLRAIGAACIAAGVAGLAI
ncbi:MAG: EamA family transporter [Rhizobacter sp.]|nr:EamA family transporter [Rhizobacter sp.]